MMIPMGELLAKAKKEGYGVAAPTTKVIRTLFGMGAMLKHNTSTMPMIGNTAPNDSFSFSSKFF